MGKTADNEKHELRATFFNNLAAGLLLGSVLLPVWALFSQASDVQELLVALADNRLTAEVVFKLVVGIVSVLSGFGAAWSLRQSADAQLNMIQD